ncbi:uncharacterized protein A4U43_C03F23100 [Asparagus officinalis]|uniref:Uncharacterized protein n=1 Tax=Asparagus officinalis TaxID=4686 RepID=A0A5P1FHG4_ASPOF|nr:uncharacterized protein A4U43_C03F23100 [Asparagus officinalis]
MGWSLAAQRIGLLPRSREAMVPGLRSGNEHHLAYGEHSEGDSIIPIELLSAKLLEGGEVGGGRGRGAKSSAKLLEGGKIGGGRGRGAKSRGGGGLSVSLRGRGFETTLGLTCLLGTPVSFWTSLRKPRG